MPWWRAIGGEWSMLGGLWSANESLVGLLGVVVAIFCVICLAGIAVSWYRGAEREWKRRRHDRR